MIRVLVADDHPVVRQGLCTMLEIEDDITVVARAEDGADAIAKARETRPDIILMDVQMPVINGIEALRRIRAEDPDARVIVLTTYHNEDYIFPSLQAGARGYLLKDSSREDLATAIRAVAAGESLLDPELAARAARAGNTTNAVVAAAAATGAVPTACPLTNRELDVLRLIASQLNNAHIAERLFISENTVKTHISNILAKLECNDRASAVLVAWRQGWIHD